MFQNRFDELYLTICKEVGGIEGLLRSFFDFMIRKTDFFYQCDPGDKMGFPPGYNKKLLLGIFQQFKQQHYKRFPPKSIQSFNKKLQEFKMKNEKPAKNEKSIQSKQTKTEKVEKKEQQLQTNLSQIKPEHTQQKKGSITAEQLVNTYNGGKNEKYSWSQQSRQVQVSVQIQPSLTKKDILVKLQNTKISIKRKTGQPIVEGELYEKIAATQSVWKIQKIVDKVFITLNLQKAEDKIWSTVFKGDPEIDTTKVNNTKPLQDFDGQTQGAIRKIMYQQQRKNMGLPTTQEQKQHQLLKKAWDAEGSPFKGQPFDPSKLNLSGFNPQP